MGAGTHKSRQTILVMGGSFNPPHLGHLALLRGCRDHILAQGQDCAVWVIPAGRHPFNKDLASAEHRIAMCRLAFLEEPDISIREEEVRRAADDPSPTYMVDTLVELAPKANGGNLRLILGSDQWRTRKRWHQWEDIERLAPPFWVERPGFSFDEITEDQPPREFEMDGGGHITPDKNRPQHQCLPPTIHNIPNLIAVSSTDVRRRVEGREDFDHLVMPQVAKYINDHALYSK